MAFHETTEQHDQRWIDEARKYSDFDSFLAAQIPLFHGTPYEFSKFAPRLTFFAEQKSFAEDYANQKSQDSEMDADITVHKMFTNSMLIFDPSNQESVEELAKRLPDEVLIAGTWGGYEAPKSEVIELMKGKILVEPPKVLPGAKEGSVVWENSFAYEGTYLVVDNSSPEFTVVREKLRREPTKEEYTALLKERVKNRLPLPDRRESIEYFGAPMKIPKVPVWEETDDNWGAFEGGDHAVMKVLQGLDYDGFKMEEKGIITYGIFNPHKLKSEQELRDLWAQAHPGAS